MKRKMNKKNKVILAGLLVFSVLIAGNIIAAVGNEDNYGNEEPSSNSGDGVSDGSSYDSPNGPNGDGSNGSGYDDPAPNSGDGVPDGSGWP